MTQTEATQSRSPSQFNTDRTYPDRWTITFNYPPMGTAGISRLRTSGGIQNTALGMIKEAVRVSEPSPANR